MPEGRSATPESIIASKLITRDQLMPRLAVAGEQGIEHVLNRLVDEELLTKWQVSQLLLGKKRGFFLNQYKLLSPIGSGGMGQVFKAHDTRSKRNFAVKILSRRTGISNAVERFRREAIATLYLQHPNIVSTHELNQDGAIHFMAMEYVEGMNLRQLVERHGPLNVEWAARIGFQMSRALEHAHEMGIIHRDVKPSNIIIAKGGIAKLADLGLAKFFGNRSDDAADSITKTGYFMGSVDYCAPEQAKDAREASEASDIYSLGCTLYYSLTGGPPFVDGTEVQKIMAHWHEEPERLELFNPSIPERFADIIHLNMLAKKTEDRFATAGDATRAFRLWLTGKGPDEPFAIGDDLEVIEEVDLGVDPRVDEQQQPIAEMPQPLSSPNFGQTNKNQEIDPLLRFFMAELKLPWWVVGLMTILVFALGFLCSRLISQW